MLDVLWAAEQPLAVRSVQERLADPVAYTTVLTVLDRLAKKGFVARRVSERAWLYEAGPSLEDLATSAVESVLETRGLDQPQVLQAIIAKYSPGP